jgi:hypothetical protein
LASEYSVPVALGGSFRGEDIVSPKNIRIACREATVSTFHEKVEKLKSAISKAEMFVNGGGDPQSGEAGPLRTELAKAWDEFAGEFVEGAVESDG